MFMMPVSLFQCPDTSSRNRILRCQRRFVRNNFVFQAILWEVRLTYELEYVTVDPTIAILLHSIFTTGTICIDLCWGKVTALYWAEQLLFNNRTIMENEAPSALLCSHRSPEIIHLILNLNRRAVEGSMPCQPSELK